jgi:hypothetical protein
VIVLGATGRNFAAGMSGGIAYILDPEGAFPAHCNNEMVELEEPSDEDMGEVRALVEEHRERTGSAVAERVLRDWDSLRDAWVKVMPMDYKRVMREREERASIEAGEPSVIAEHGDGDGRGPVRAGQAPPYNGGDGREEAREVGEAGQHEDAAVAGERGRKAAEAAGADEATQNEAASGAEEEVLPHGG